MFAAWAKIIYKKMSSDGIKVGDLVRLKDDDGLNVGVGVVLERREDCAKITELLDDLRASGDDKEVLLVEEIPEYLLFKPIYLVLWQGDNISPTDRPVWMFKTELEVVKKKGK